MALVLLEEHDVLAHPDGPDAARLGALGDRVEQLGRGHRARRRHPQVELHRHAPSPLQHEVADLVGRLRRRDRVGLAGPDRERTVDLLADEDHGPLGVEVAPEVPGGDAGRHELLEHADHVEPDHHERAAHGGRALGAGGGLGGHGQAEEGRALVDALEQRRA